MLKESHERARQLAASGMLAEANDVYRELVDESDDDSHRAQLLNDLAVIYSCCNEFHAASELYQKAAAIDPGFDLCQSNREMLETVSILEGIGEINQESHSAQPRIAILSLLFNWPSTGGGTVHTAELAKFLGKAGYDVRHFSANYEPWEIGQITETPPHAVEQIHFDQSSWDRETIQRRFRAAVDVFNPDLCIIACSWNFKPLLAEAVNHYPYILRTAAMENLCPLNNVRLLPDGKGGTHKCNRTQLGSPHVCKRCVEVNHELCGSLHVAERQLSGYGSIDYDRQLRSAISGAEAVFAVNPLIAAMFGPYAKRVDVVPSGFDPARFPEPDFERQKGSTQRCRILFAGLTDEYIKGFHILEQAADELWRDRQDFEVIITADQRQQGQPWASYLGWQSQAVLPKLMRRCDLLVFPTVAEEALGRSAVEAMGCGLPVIASRIGGLQFVVSDGGSGLLVEPGNVSELKQQLAFLIDHPNERIAMGRVGRRRFEQEFLWETIIDRHYRPLIERCTASK